MRKEIKVYKVSVDDLEVKSLREITPELLEEILSPDMEKEGFFWNAMALLPVVEKAEEEEEFQEEETGNFNFSALNETSSKEEKTEEETTENLLFKKVRVKERYFLTCKEQGYAGNGFSVGANFVLLPLQKKDSDESLVGLYRMYSGEVIVLPEDILDMEDADEKDQTYFVSKGVVALPETAPEHPFFVSEYEKHEKKFVAYYLYREFSEKSGKLVLEHDLSREMLIIEGVSCGKVKEHEYVPFYFMYNDFKPEK